MDQLDSAGQQFYRWLNSPEWLPETAYRRNTGLYPLVCYVNTIIGTCLSKNYEMAALFIARAVDHMKSVPPSAQEERYYILAASYFAHVVDHIRRAAPEVTLDADRIPAAILAPHALRRPDTLTQSGDHDLYFWRSSPASSIGRCNTWTKSISRSLEA